MNSIVNQSASTNAFKTLIRQMESLREMILQPSRPGRETLPELSPDRMASAQNLLHYLALRNQDIRPLQDKLARVGLSSLGRIEPHVLETINAVLHNLYLLSGRQQSTAESLANYTDFDTAAKRLEYNTARLLGQQPKNRRAHIIVTMPAPAADDFLMVHELLQSGMNCMRINCAHGDRKVWSRMIANLRNAERVTGKSCRILMDLVGPKMRLGPMQSIPSSLKIKPLRASDGQVLRAARIWLTPAREVLSEMIAADASLGVDRDWLLHIEKGDRVYFRDARGSRRRWRIREVTADGCWAEARKTCYVVNGLVLQLQKKRGDRDLETQISGLAAKDSVCHIRVGDILLMLATDKPGKPAVHDHDGELLNPGQVSLPIPEVYRDVRLGEPVHFDDGRISGIVEKRFPKKLQIRITHTRNRVEKLEANRGVNLPDTSLNLPALSCRDMDDIEFAAEHADMIGMSFANSPDDVRALYQRFQELGCENVGAVLKIETKRGFYNLPAMLLEALKFSACGVMIARGDLAVECGFERLSEVQEEILWVCESAHVPVIWATQVLEGLTKHGHASRAEITDAAMAQMAEAVMLNKGPHITEAVIMLDNILQRMQGHHRKKRSTLRKLRLAACRI